MSSFPPFSHGTSWRGRTVELKRSADVHGYTLRSLLNKLGIGTCDLLLLNCEGAEIFAMRQLAEQPPLRDRVRQFATSNHCAHVSCYPKGVWDCLMYDLAPHYQAERLPFAAIPYYLFTRKVDTDALTTKDAKDTKNEDLCERHRGLAPSGHERPMSAVRKRGFRRPPLCPLW